MAEDTGDASAFDFRLYRYTPSLPAAIVFVVVFAVLSGLHTWRLMRHRALYFTAFTIGGYCKAPHMMTLRGREISSWALGTILT